MIRSFVINILLLQLILLSTKAGAQGNFAFSGMETLNFGIVDLSASSPATWATDRLAVPGYFSVANNASYSGSSDQHNIDGYVKKYGNHAFTFPVGMINDIRAISISAPNAITDAYAVAWIPGDPGFNADVTEPFAGPHPVTVVTVPLESVSNVGQWDWQIGDGGNLGQGTTGNGSGLIITVSIPDVSGFANASSLRLAGWNGNSWIDLSGTSTANGNSENSTLSGIMIPGITAIGIGSVSTPLLLDNIILTAKGSNCSANLQWKTRSLFNVDTFLVEQSKNGVDYNVVNYVGALNSANENNYKINIAQSEGVYHYRLKILYHNASVKYSNAVTCRTECKATDHLVLYPNPLSDNQPLINLKINTNYRGKVFLVITDEHGRHLMNQPRIINDQQTIIQIAANDLAQGLYYLHLIKTDGSLLDDVKEFIKR